MTIFLIVLVRFVAEMGDKTQLLLVAMASKYKISQILAGTWLATILLNILAVFVGAALSQYLDMRIIKIIAGFAFFWFACAALTDSGQEEENYSGRGRFGPVLAIFGSSFSESWETKHSFPPSHWPPLTRSTAFPTPPQYLPDALWD